MAMTSNRGRKIGTQCSADVLKELRLFLLVFGSSTLANQSCIVQMERMTSVHSAQCTLILNQIINPQTNQIINPQTILITSCMAGMTMGIILTHSWCYLQWAEALVVFQQAADLIGLESRKSLWGQFWSAHQRFFKYLCIAAKVPRLVELAQEELARGKVWEQHPPASPGLLCSLQPKGVNYCSVWQPVQTSLKLNLSPE